MARVKLSAPRRQLRKKPSETERVNSPISQTPRSPATRPRTRTAQSNAPSTPGTERQRKSHRYKPGTVALREIRHFQKTWNLLIPAASFIRVVKYITAEHSRAVSRWTAEALVALQE
ncbi:histone H3-like centromeric protein HTR12 isoform X2 [Ricinus communis]|nr:histone H3-like centromeric protein HTR12 isoform X2 [Ricinus communis]